jgi:hypothetical protein
MERGARGAVVGERLYIRRGDAFAGTLTVYVDGTANVATPALIDADPGICVWTNPALFHCYQSSATTATVTSGTLAFADRA